jgi:hypothetical protein
VKILVCGSRHWEDWGLMERVLGAFKMMDPLLVHGAASGADTMADRVAKELGWPVPTRYPVTREEWNEQGKRAGPLRNRRMFDTERPDLVIAFRASGESRGTDDMVAYARAKWCPVWVVREGE